HQVIPDEAARLDGIERRDRGRSSEEFDCDEHARSTDGRRGKESSNHERVVSLGIYASEDPLANARRRGTSVDLGVNIDGEATLRRGRAGCWRAAHGYDAPVPLVTFAAVRVSSCVTTARSPERKCSHRRRRESNGRDYGTIAIGACQNAALPLVGSIT